MCSFNLYRDYSNSFTLSKASELLLPRGNRIRVHTALKYGKTYPICDAPLSFRHTNRAATTVLLCQQKHNAVWLSWRSKRYTVSTVSTVLEPSTATINPVVKIKYFSPHNLKSDHHKNFPWWKIFKMVFQFIFIILFLVSC